MDRRALPFVSVIIPVYNDRDRLQTCLEKLENQTYPQHLYEVIVIDNGSSDLEIIKDIVARFPRFSLAQESFPSSYAARNKGISLAKGEIIAFTDADCLPYLDWIEQGVNHLLSVPSCGLVGGKIELFFQNSNRLTPVELYEKFHAFPQKKFIEQHHYGATANIFTFKRVIEQVGNFEAQLKSNGDFEWGQRIFLAGYQQVYAESVCVAHPARSSFKELYQRNLRLAGGTYDLFRRKKLPRLDFHKLLLKSLLKDLIDPFQFCLKTFKDRKIAKLNQKISICITRFFMMHLRFLEKVRLQIGGISYRQ
jgi:glycosyltransferase involved in cell wall biosynthesis